MGVDPNWGVSPFVPKYPVLSLLVLLCFPRGPEREQMGTKEDSEMPPVLLGQLGIP